MQKKTLLVVLGLTLLLFLPIASAYSGVGSGTAGDPYIVTSCLQLNETRNALSSVYKLNTTIDCSETVNWNNGANKGWVPVGNPLSTGFTGTFDGNGKGILNLYGNATASLFGWVTGTIKNLTVYNANFTNLSSSAAGILASGCYGGANISYVQVTGTIRSNTGSIGGICGVASNWVNSPNYISYSYASVTLTTGGYSGQFVALTDYHLNLTNSYAVSYGGNFIGRTTFAINLSNLYFEDWSGSANFYTNTTGINRQNIYITGTSSPNNFLTLVNNDGSNAWFGSYLGTTNDQASYSGFDFTNVWTITGDIATLRSNPINTYVTSAAFSSPTQNNNTNITSLPTFAVTATGGNLANITINIYYSNGTLYNTTTSTSSPYSKSYTAIAQGTIYVNATARTNDGLTYNTETRQYLVDTAAANYSYDAPTPNDGQVIPTRNATINISSNSADVANITLRLYNSTGSLLFTNSSTGNRSTLTLTNLLNGNYTYNATVYDTSGNVNLTTNRTFYVNYTYNTINSLVANATPVTIFNNFTFKVNVTNTINSITSVNVSVLYGNGTQVNYTTSLSGGLYNTTTITAQSANYTVSVYTNDGTNLTGGLILNVTDTFSTNPTNYISTVQAGQNFTFNMTTYGDSSSNLSFNYTFAFANVSYFNSSYTASTDNYQYNGTHLIIIATNASTPDGTYYGNVTVRRLVDNRTTVMNLTLGVATQFGQPYVYNLSTLNVAITSDASASQIITINNTGTYNLTSCVPTLTGDFVGWSFYSWDNASFNVGVNSSKNITLTFTNPPATTYAGYMQVTCVATVGGIQNTLSPGNQPIVNLISTTPSIPPSGGGGSSTVQLIGGTNQTFSISPKVQTVYITPGSSRTFEIKITDVSNSPMTLSLKFNQNTSWVRFSDGTTEATVKLTPAVGIASPSQYVAYTITVPANVDFADYGAQLIVQSGSQTEIQQINIIVQPSLFSGLFNTLSKSVYSTEPVCKAYSTVDLTACVDTSSGFNITVWQIALVFVALLGLVGYAIRK